MNRAICASIAIATVELAALSGKADEVHLSDMQQTPVLTPQPQQPVTTEAVGVNGDNFAGSSQSGTFSLADLGVADLDRQDQTPNIDVRNDGSSNRSGRFVEFGDLVLDHDFNDITFDIRMQLLRLHPTGQ